MADAYGVNHETMRGQSRCIEGLPAMKYTLQRYIRLIDKHDYIAINGVPMTVFGPFPTSEEAKVWWFDHAKDHAADIEVIAVPESPDSDGGPDG